MSRFVLQFPDGFTDPLPPRVTLREALEITRGRDDQLHVSWAKDGPRYAVRTGSPKATAEWDAWILDEVRRQDVEVAA